MWCTKHLDFYVLIPTAEAEQKCRYVIDISLFWIRPKEGQADVIYCSLSVSFLGDRDTLIQMSTVTFLVIFYNSCLTLYFPLLFAEDKNCHFICRPF